MPTGQGVAVKPGKRSGEYSATAATAVGDERIPSEG